MGSFDHPAPGQVPTCTFPNRSFFHAGTSSGAVVNWPPLDQFPVHNTAETLFDRLEAAGLSWRVYCDPPCHASLTGVIHAARLKPKFTTNSFSTDQFLEDAASGNLPAYSFIEPQVIGHDHNDMHPPFDELFEAVARDRGVPVPVPDVLTADPPSSLIAGEELLARVYNAIRNSTADGSNHLNTTLLVTFDEHGGTYDHAPPPLAVPPSGKEVPGQMGFTFNRSGVRIPTLAISAWIPEKTFVTEEYRATSLIATMTERWTLGTPLTARDASARSFAGIFTDQCRTQDRWPEIIPRPVPPGPVSALRLDAPLGLLGKAIIGGVMALGKDMGADVPDLPMEGAVTAQQGMDAVQHVIGPLFPNLQA
ncbi:MAG: alkaline phosphatase family protein [Candidatus Nanopelagicales bacterium]